MSTKDASMPRQRRAKKILSPSAKYEIWLQLVRGETTIAQAAAEAGVDRSTIIRVRQVAKETVRKHLIGALPATPPSTMLPATRRGQPGTHPR